MDTDHDTTGRLVRRVSELHGTEVALTVRAHYPAALQLLADGWTLDGALNHVQGVCDVTICTHPDHRPTSTTEACLCCGQRPAGWGHFAWYCEACAAQPLAGCRHGF